VRLESLPYFVRLEAAAPAFDLPLDDNSADSAGFDD